MNILNKHEKTPLYTLLHLLTWSKSYFTTDSLFKKKAKSDMNPLNVCLTDSCSFSQTQPVAGRMFTVIRGNTHETARALCFHQLPLIKSTHLQALL